MLLYVTMVISFSAYACTVTNKVAHTAKGRLSITLWGVYSFMECLNSLIYLVQSIR